ncbi:MAG: MFS transporter [Fimbriimonadaceae bacterium]|nr:MFS transporter [Chthonomonadaceae bacterium]MCO5295973.1 MFS transporter [Fimbriimonadaceae bacterium]
MLAALRLKLSASQLRVFRHRDFRLLWSGSFFSFTGSWVQNIAQGWLVYEITHDEAKLAFVTFCAMAPVSLFGPFAGALSDTFNKRKVLVFTQSVFGLCALFLMVASWPTPGHPLGFVQYWHVLVVSLIVGCMACLEMPTRQSVISRVVPSEELPMAVPFNAMTFNFARVVGPAIGGILLAAYGPRSCYGVNAVSYLALIFAALAIRADLGAGTREPQPIKDLLFEGMLYTFRDLRLRTLFVMESIVSMFGLFYISLMPAIAKDMLGLDEKGLGLAMTFIGIGAFLGLVLMVMTSHRPVKAFVVRASMILIGVGLSLLAFARTGPAAYPILALIGAAAIMQFNTTNTLFQLLSPDRLRGRVLAMHIWALSGLGPFGVLFFGWLAHGTSLQLALHVGGACVLAGGLWGWAFRRGLAGVQ